MTTAPSPFSLPAFSLREVVAEVCETHLEADPAKLVQPVLDNIDPAYYKEALRQALHGFIVAHVVGSRNATRQSGTPQSSMGRKIGRPRLDGLSKFLTSRQYSPARNDWILLAEATIDDLRSMAAKRQETAQQFHALSLWYYSMANELKSNSVHTIADLPVLVQQRLLESRPT
jgi:hypothetical protein